MRVICAAGTTTFLGFFFACVLLRGFGLEIRWSLVLLESYVAMAAGMIGATFHWAMTT